MIAIIFFQIFKPLKAGLQQKKIEKRQVNLELHIQTLSDLIELAHKVDIDYKLTPDVEYNIDLAMIKNLLPEMVNLNNMIGQEGIKTQIANMILYFSLHLFGLFSVFFL